MMQSVMKFTLGTLFAILLAGCGGGGSSSGGGGNIVTGTAEGVYSGTVTGGNSFDGIVLEDGTFYSLYGTRTGGVLYVGGFATGNGTSYNGSYTIANLKDYLSSGVIYTGTVSASYGVGSTLSGTLIENGVTGTFTSTVIPTSTYVYNAGANLSHISGAWALTDLQGAAVSMNIATSGAFTATSAGCSFSGSLTPRASGKNVFNLAITFGGSPCALPGQTATGIAIEYVLSNGLRQLIMAGTNVAQTAGTAAFGTR